MAPSESKTIVLRGLRFYSGTMEICPKSLFAPRTKRMMECSMFVKSHRSQDKGHLSRKCAHMVVAKSNPFCSRSKQRLLFVVWMAPKQFSVNDQSRQ
ncbi:MAG: hypothetical protein DWH78_09500 [Planctomycetota bacterium]|nr:MAG: hypothetical protein DWH78_09500 [Planctomycetota bacterium]